jgi:hypothetical protein
LILALNETRKTLLASRLHVVEPAPQRPSAVVEDIRPGDGVLLEPYRKIDTRRLQGPVDLVYLDADHRVLAVSSVKTGSSCPEVIGAASLLGLASGTIRLSDTRKGDHIVLESIAASAEADPAVTRAPRT